MADEKRKKRSPKDMAATNENRESLNTILSDLRLKNNSLELDLNSLQIEAENINGIMERSNLSDIGSQTSAGRDSPTLRSHEINLQEEEARLRKTAGTDRKIRSGEPAGSRRV